LFITTTTTAERRALGFFCFYGCLMTVMAGLERGAFSVMPLLYLLVVIIFCVKTSFEYHKERGIKRVGHLCFQL
jgi:uncharacterized membrane protein